MHRKQIQVTAANLQHAWENKCEYVSGDLSSTCFWLSRYNHYNIRILFKKEICSSNYLHCAIKWPGKQSWIFQEPKVFHCFPVGLQKDIVLRLPMPYLNIKEVSVTTLSVLSRWGAGKNVLTVQSPFFYYYEFIWVKLKTYAWEQDLKRSRLKSFILVAFQ